MISHLIIKPDTKELSITSNAQYVIVVDHMPPVEHIQIDEDTIFKNTIINLFNQSNISIDSKTFIFDSYMCFDDFRGVSTVFSNQFFLSTVQEFYNSMPNWNSVPIFEVNKKLSAMMNKIRPNREILSLVLANWFDSTHLLFSSPKLLERKINCQEYLHNTPYQFDYTKILSETWFQSEGVEKLSSSTNNYSSVSNEIAFRDCLFENLFKGAAISLITEPTYFENGCHLSEKTLMSIYAGHFLIWVGGYKNAEYAKKLGIDIFDDIIDHSYQYIKHPGERSVEAVRRNLKLLNDVKEQAKLREKHLNRLNENLKLVRNYNSLRKSTQYNINDPILYQKMFELFPFAF